ncbi:hypothetical protein ACIQOU_21025 [Streptomyces sp. NPDC091279]|uniref:hypothetical protein n=1 Tax=Streptomyces sp. NPDC091279 TaxID=3365983 RepID=UPI0038228EB8
MKTAGQFNSPPKDYHLVVPDGWFRLLLEPDQRDRSIVALANLTFSGRDDVPHLKREFMHDLQRRAKGAYRVGGTELYLSTMTVGPLPLASSLLISVPSQDEWPQVSDVEELAEHMADKVLGDDHEVGVAELAAAGKAVRQRKREAPDSAAQLGNTLPTTTLTYYVPIPATTRWLMLTFSTPVDPLADRMVELFDTVAGTLYWE